jgi:ribosomal-protein-alanine N-acetyltransferase
VIIRLATTADIPSMMMLEKHAATAGHWSREQYDVAFKPELPRRKSLALVVERDRAVIAFLVARAIDSEWEIENVAVAGPSRRRGLGTRLVGEFIARAQKQGAKAVFLEVRESNKAARMLYEKWEFVESGLRKQYYHDPAENAVVYRLEFA